MVHMNVYDHSNTQIKVRIIQIPTTPRIPTSTHTVTHPIFLRQQQRGQQKKNKLIRNAP